MSEAEIRIGLIGCGRRAASWVDRIGSESRARVVAVCDKYRPRAETMKARALRLRSAQAGDDQIELYVDHRRMLSDDGCDAVVITTEPEHQAGLSAESMDAGYHVISEVPAAYSIEDCWRIVLTSERTGKVYCLAEQLRFSPMVHAWRELVRTGALGCILFAEGHYLHAMEPWRYWLHAETGKAMTWEEASRCPDKKVRSRLWHMPHPILYAPHELSPLLKILDDRVVHVSCCTTGAPSKRYREAPFPGMTEEFPVADLEVALMQTDKGTIVRFAGGFQVPTSQTHWLHLFGTKGEVETGRGKGEVGYRYLYPDPLIKGGEDHVPRTPVDWSDPDLLPAEARAFGHGGMDYYPLASFLDSIIDGKAPDIDLYQAVETAAPVIIAARSAEQDGARLDVPDFRPGPDRRRGERPSSG